MRKLVLPLLLLLTACRAGTPDYTPSDFRFTQQPSIKFNVAQIEVLDADANNTRNSETEYRLRTSPREAIHQWAKDCLIAAGKSGSLEITIDRASVKESKLATKPGVTGLFTNEPASRFDTEVLVTMRLYSGTSALSTADAQVRVTRFDELMEDASVADRERFFDGMLAKLMADFGREATQQMGRYFSGYILP